MSDRRSRFRHAHHDRGVRAVRVPIVLGAAACALAACAPEPAPRCDISVTQEISFTGGPASDTVSASAIGAACDKATVLYIVHDAEGRPIWAWVSPMSRAFGDEIRAEEPDEMQDFLERWAQPDLATTGAAPAWPSLAAGQSTLDQFTYEDIRARDLPMLCHYSGTARQICVFWEPVAGGAGHYFERVVEESEE